jgi:hypothetical protein
MNVDIKVFRKWTLLLGGVVGFFIVLIADVFLNKDVNYGIYVLLGGMMGLDSVLSREAAVKADKAAALEPPEPTIDTVVRVP